MPATAGPDRWTPIGPEGANVVALAIDPSTPTTIYAVDAGQSWTSTNSGLTDTIPITVSALAIVSGSPPALYAGTPDGLFKSIDGAAHWMPLDIGPAGLIPRVIAIAPV